MKHWVADYIQAQKAAHDSIPVEAVAELIEQLRVALKEDRQIFIFGNGGSAATASHFACDLGKGTIQRGKRRLRVISLCDQIPMMTAWANDADYSDIFVEQLSNLLNEEDLVIGISSSGNSPNVLKALRYAKDQRATTAALTGFRGGQVRDIVDQCLIVPSTSVQIIEDIHLILGHIIFLQVCAKIKMEPSVPINEPTAG